MGEGKTGGGAEDRGRGRQRERWRLGGEAERPS